MQKRYKSKTLWAAILALILFVLKTYCKIDIPEGETLIDMFLLVLTLLGIINNPTNKHKL